MNLKHHFERRSALPTAFILIVVAVLTLLFPEVWYPQENAWQLSVKKHIPGINGGLSGLTRNPDSETLFAVTDHPSSVVELDRDGNVLRVVSSAEDHDFEAIEYLGQNLYTLSRERERTLGTYRIDGDTLLLSPPLYTLTLNINHNSDNAGFEGLARGMTGNTLMVAQEKKHSIFTPPIVQQIR